MMRRTSAARGREAQTILVVSRVDEPHSFSEQGCRSIRTVNIIELKKHIENNMLLEEICLSVSLCLFVHLHYQNVRGSAITPAPSPRNCAVDRRIAEPIGVTDVGVQ
jgi:hypothetical protein